MSSATKVTITYDDGTEQVVDVAQPSAPAPVTVTEVDVLSSDGSAKKFVPAQ